jgi:hypothetical protein
MTLLTSDHLKGHCSAVMISINALWVEAFFYLPTDYARTATDNTVFELTGMH